MTTVTIYKTVNQEYRGFTCFGHAGYARRFQKDILCAGISALVINTLNSMEELHHEEMTVVTNEKTGFIKCDFTNSLQDASIILMDSMVFGLQNLSKTYGEKYLLVNFEEV